MKKIDIMYFHIIISILFFIIGFYISDVIYQNIANVGITTNSLLNSEHSNPGIMFFFKNNIRFFLLVSIMPFINILFFSMQFINLGTSVQSMMDLNLSLDIQFQMLYRHGVFEIIALFLAILISYKLWNYTRDILNDKKRNWKKEMVIVGVMYLFITLCTFAGAILEGTVNVAI